MEITSSPESVDQPTRDVKTSAALIYLYRAAPHKDSASGYHVGVDRARGFGAFPSMLLGRLQGRWRWTGDWMEGVKVG